MKIVHLTSVHPYGDTRIFWKYCCSLVQHGFECHLIAVGEFNGVLEGVHVHGLSGSDKSRFQRMIRTGWRLYKKALALNADIYHFHDPELIPLCLLLRLHGYRVIYDVHEDVYNDIQTKHWIPPSIRWIMAKNFRVFEFWAARRFSYICTSTPYIRDRFLSVTPRVVEINNYPIENELYQLNGSERLTKRDDLQVCYVGSISPERGIYQLIEAVQMAGVELLLAGSFSPLSARNRASSMKGWACVQELGQLNRIQVASTMAHALAGMVTLLPIPQFRDSQPVKLFEYMSAGIPIIASDFPLWKKIVEGNQCGLCVDPEKPEEIAEAIRYMQDHPEEAKKMGENGRRVVLEKYNWKQEVLKVIKVYQEEV
jgi:glycosyltransferase involved in cell wall biosynthesis